MARIEAPEPTSFLPDSGEETKTGDDGASEAHAEPASAATEPSDTATETVAQKDSTGHYVEASLAESS